jgi:hypothetical protein
VLAEYFVRKIDHIIAKRINLESAVGFTQNLNSNIGPKLR